MHWIIPTYTFDLMLRLILTVEVLIIIYYVNKQNLFVKCYQNIYINDFFFFKYFYYEIKLKGFHGCNILWILYVHSVAVFVSKQMMHKRSYIPVGKYYNKNILLCFVFESVTIIHFSHTYKVYQIKYMHVSNAVISFLLL